MVNITQEGEDILDYNYHKEYPLFGHKNIRINKELFIIRKCFVENNEIIIKLQSKKTGDIKDYLVTEFTPKRVRAYKPVKNNLYSAIKKLVNKYIKKQIVK
jgi:hypothetical protein